MCCSRSAERPSNVWQGVLLPPIGMLLNRAPSLGEPKRAVKQPPCARAKYRACGGEASGFPRGSPTGREPSNPGPKTKPRNAAASGETEASGRGSLFLRRFLLGVFASGSFRRLAFCSRILFRRSCLLCSSHGRLRQVDESSRSRCFAPDNIGGARTHLNEVESCIWTRLGHCWQATSVRRFPG